MTTQKPLPTMDAAAVLTASLEREKGVKGSDLALVQLLESTILRVDATDNAWEKAAAAILQLAASRAVSRMEAP